MGRWETQSVDASFNFAGFSLGGTWTPSDAEREAAWDLLIELSTRTSINELGDQTGSLSAALSSLYSLFGTTRDLLRSHGAVVGASHGTGNLSLGIIAIRVLNDVLRPFLSTWHTQLEAHRHLKPDEMPEIDWERQWELEPALRDELAAIRPVIRQYVLVLAEIAQVTELSDAVLRERNLPLQPVSDKGPISADGVELAFEPRNQMVRWFDLRVLAVSGWRIVRMPKRDKREEFPVTKEPSVLHRDWCDAHDSDPYWFDYVADLGDAFDPTMAVAWWLSQAKVASGDERVGELERGPLLIMGGDEVYPYPTKSVYRNQLIGPYEAALDASVERELLAIPGNHDWYDNLEEFSRIFCGSDSFAQLEGNSVDAGGYRTPQRAPWFSAVLPQGWVVWGMDTGLTGDLNDRQIEYFTAQAAALEADSDQQHDIILCSPVPWWRLREKRKGGHGYDDEYATLSDFLERVLPPNASLRLCLAGDTHIYAHYVTQSVAPRYEPVHHITSGGGGAFLHPTHNLAPQVPQGSAEDPWFQLEGHWPPRATSKHELARSSVGLAFDRQNLSMGSLLAALHLLVAVIAGGKVRSWLSSGPDESFGGALISVLAKLASNPYGWVAAVVLVALFTFAVPQPSVGEPIVVRAARRYGFIHGLVQVVCWAIAAVVGALVAWWLADRLDSATDPLYTVGALAGAALGAFLSTIAIAHYLRIVNQNRRIHDNVAFSGRHLTGFKHFLRMRIDPQSGDLTVYAVGLEHVQAGWADALQTEGRKPPHGFASLVETITIQKSQRSESC